MYLPKHFKEDDARAIHALIDQYPLATVITAGEDGPFVNHLPLLRVSAADRAQRLIGHLARRNPQWMQLRDQARATAVFHGPNAYITPSWYAEHDVPTWNYAVVHVRGRVRMIEDGEGIIAILEKMTERFERDSAKPWAFGLPGDLSDPELVARAIVGFEIEMDQVDAKLKLSQNRSAADRAGVIAGLRERSDEMSARVREMMEGI